jgi:opacity protein-like surface antigen
MFKKVLLGIAILTSTIGVASAAGAAPYIGAGLGVTTNTQNSSSLFGSYRGVPFNVFAGFGGVVTESFYLAGEVAGTLGTAVVSDYGSLKTTYGYGVSILPGVMLSDHTLAFARAGVVRSRFSEVSQTQTGGQFGVGLQTGLTQNLDLRGEYDFTAYRKITTALIPGVNMSTSPRQDAFTLSLVYKFE